MIVSWDIPLGVSSARRSSAPQLRMRNHAAIAGQCCPGTMLPSTVGKPGCAGPARSPCRGHHVQPCPSSGHSSEPERPPAPAPVLTAVKLMYAGAAVSVASLAASLAYTLADLVGTKDAIGQAHLSLPGMAAAQPGTVTRPRCTRSSRW